jgi:hypothetical protein
MWKRRITLLRLRASIRSRGARPLLARKGRFVIWESRATVVPRNRTIQQLAPYSSISPSLIFRLWWDKNGFRDKIKWAGSACGNYKSSQERRRRVLRWVWKRWRFLCHVNLLIGGEESRGWNNGMRLEVSHGHIWCPMEITCVCLSRLVEGGRGGGREGPVLYTVHGPPIAL